jgi:arsenate reductase
MNGRLSFRESIGFVALMTCLPAEGAGEKRGTTIVFVCEHGSVKSLIAARWFNKLAAERGLKHRAISRGMAPDAAVPKGIVEELRHDGFEVENFTPAPLSKPDLRDAERVVSIGIDVSRVTRGDRVKVDEWISIPAASENYAASRDAMLGRIGRLLTELKNKEKP